MLLVIVAGAAGRPTRRWNLATAVRVAEPYQPPAGTSRDLLHVLDGPAGVAVAQQRLGRRRPVAPGPRGRGGLAGPGGRSRGGVRAGDDADRGSTADCQADREDGRRGALRGGAGLAGLAVLAQGAADRPPRTGLAGLDGARKRCPSGSDGHGCLPTPVKLAVGFGLRVNSPVRSRGLHPRDPTTHGRDPTSWVPHPCHGVRGEHVCLAGLGVDTHAVRRICRTADDCITERSRRKPSDPQRPSGKALNASLTGQGPQMNTRCPERDSERLSGGRTADSCDPSHSRPVALCDNEHSAVLRPGPSAEQFDEPLETHVAA